MVDYAGIAVVVASVGIFVACVAAVIALLRITSRVKDTHGMVTQIDGAVNGKLPGETTMVSQVQDLHDHMPADPKGVLPLLHQLAIDIDELKREIRREG